jgi:hypothetical protein
VLFTRITNENLVYPDPETPFIEHWGVNAIYVAVCCLLLCAVFSFIYALLQNNESEILLRAICQTDSRNLLFIRLVCPSLPSVPMRIRMGLHDTANGNLGSRNHDQTTT